VKVTVPVEAGENPEGNKKGKDGCPMKTKNAKALVPGETRNNSTSDK